MEVESGEQDEQQKLAESVVARPAQELIYGALYELSVHSSISSMENDFLDRLAELWSLEFEHVLPTNLPR
jgi:hypothetical protein